MKQFSKNILSAIFVLCVFLISAANSHAAKSVTDYSFSDKKGATELRINLSDITEYKEFFLDNPSRLVIDLKDTIWSVKDTLSDDKGSKFITRLRQGIQDGTDLRLVLDLKNKMAIEDILFVLPGKKSKSHALLVKLKNITSTTTKKGAETTNKYAYNSKLPFTVPSFKPNGSKPSSANKTDKNAPIPIAKPIKKKKYMPIIVIDAGHGGKDPGAIGRSGAQEKRITLEYAKSLKKALEKTGRYKIYLTRPNDQFISLKNRVLKAKRIKADLLISLHADSHPNPKTRGLSVYTISEKRAKYETFKLLKESERKEVLHDVDLKHEDDDVKKMMLDLAKRQNSNTSAKFAEMLVNEMGDEAKLLRNTHRSAGFMVLTGIEVPSVLVELGYMSNRYEEKLLRTRSYRERLVNSMKTAIDKYFKK